MTNGLVESYNRTRKFSKKSLLPHRYLTQGTKSVIGMCVEYMEQLQRPTTQSKKQKRQSTATKQQTFSTHDKDIEQSYYTSVDEYNKKGSRIIPAQISGSGYQRSILLGNFKINTCVKCLFTCSVFVI